MYKLHYSSMADKYVNPTVVYLDVLVEAMALYSIVDDLQEHKVSGLNEKKQAIHKNVIINLCASFESFVESAIETGLDFLTKNSNSSDQIPINVRLRISNKLKNKSDERKIWEISDDGWKSLVIDNYKELNEKFNTPRPDKINDYVYKSIGFENISHSWKWAGQSYVKSEKKLNEFMTVRGDIVHRLISPNKLYAQNIDSFINFLYRLSAITSNTLGDHIESLIGEAPWYKCEVKDIGK